MIKFDRAAANQSVAAPDTPAVTLPAGEKAMGVIVRFDGLVTGDNPQNILSTGSVGVARSFNAVYFTLGAATSAQQGRVSLYADSSATLASALTTATQLSSGTHLFIFQWTTTELTVYRCEINGAARTAADVVTEGATSGSNFMKGLDSFGLMYGSRLDNTANRKCDQSLGRGFMCLGTLTMAEIARLANGEEISDLGKAVVWNTRMSSVSDVIDRGPNAVAFTVNGSPTTSAEPAFTYTPAPNPEPETDTVDVTPPANRRMLKSANGGASIPVSGAYTGTVPTSVEYQVYTEDGTTVRQAWAAASGFGATGGTWTGTVSLPVGMGRLAVRSKSGATVLATSAVKSEVFGAGALGAIIGSSSASKLFTSSSGTGFTVAANTSVLSGSTPVWSGMSSTGAGTLMASNLATKLGMPVGLLNYGSDGSTLSTWNNKTSSLWLAFAAAVASAGGKLDFVYITVGSNDARNGSLSSRLAHLANMRTLVASIRELTGQPNLPILWSGSNNRPELSEIQANRLRMAETDIGSDLNVWHVQTTDLPLSTDNVHLTVAGFQASVARTSYVLGDGLSGGAYHRGPRIAGLTFEGADVFVDVAHTNGTDLSPATGGTGFTLTDASGTPALVSTARVSATRYRATFDRPLVAPVVARYQSGGAPDVSAAIFDNGTTPLPMLVETEMATTAASVEPVPDTTAPVMSGAVSATNITASSANISWSAATDNVAVTGYEYSINGGTSYVNTGTSRAVSLTGLMAETAYQLRARAYDAAGNKSNVVSGILTTLQEDNTTIPTDIDATKVPPERRVIFEGSKRVVPFYGSINKVRF